MRIGVLSDTHGSLHYFDKAMQVLGRCDAYIHCGDILPVSSRSIAHGYEPERLAMRINECAQYHLIEGNGDHVSRPLLPNHPLHKELSITIGSHRIFATHGHHYSPMGMLMRARELGATILCYGHSHMKELARYEELTLVNPGSTTLPRDGMRSAACIEDQQIVLYNIDTGSVIDSITLPAE